MSKMKRLYEELIQVEHEIAEIEDHVEEVKNNEEGSIERSKKLARMYTELGDRAKRLLDLDESLRKVKWEEYLESYLNNKKKETRGD